MLQCDRAKRPLYEGVEAELNATHQLAQTVPEFQQRGSPASWKPENETLT